MTWLLLFASGCLLVVGSVFGLLFFSKLQERIGWLQDHYWVKFYFSTLLLLACREWGWLWIVSAIPRDFLLGERSCFLVCFFKRVKVVPLKEIESVSVPVRSGRFAKKEIVFRLKTGAVYRCGVERPEVVASAIESAIGNPSPSGVSAAAAQAGR